jgi:Fe2+ transport system protein B
MTGITPAGYLYFGLYRFVGDFGAGTLVDFLEEGVFETYFNPWITGVVKVIIPWVALQELFVGEYGIMTLGLRYAVGIILPIVATFFLFFSMLEDSGYFPARLFWWTGFQEDRPDRQGGHPDGARLWMRYHGYHGDADLKPYGKGS